MSLRIALFGGGPFARDALDRLSGAGHEVVVVYAPPEGGRPDPLAERATERGLSLERRRYFRRKSGEAIPAALESYRKYDADLNVLAVVNVFIPQEITDAPKRGSLCFHPSLLPRFRGGAAVNWQVLLGEAEAGVSIFAPDSGVDTGPIVVQRGGVRLDPDETTGTLFFQKLYPLGLEALDEAVALVDAGRARPAPQDHSKATFQGLVDDEVAAIDFAEPAESVYRKVRGCDPQPGAFARLGDQVVRLFDARLDAGLEGGGGTTGEVVAVDERGLALALDGGVLRVARVRADAGKEAAAEFAARAGLTAGARLRSG